MQCVVHYTDVNRTYSVLKRLSQNQHQRLLEGKRVREQETLPENKHTTQCETIPVPDFVAKFHGLHLEPCYKKFTSILPPSRKRNAGNDPKSIVDQNGEDKNAALDQEIFSLRFAFTASGIEKQ